MHHVPLIKLICHLQCSHLVDLMLAGRIHDVPPPHLLGRDWSIIDLPLSRLLGLIHRDDVELGLELEVFLSELGGRHIVHLDGLGFLGI
jgi:hypothetical protein